MRRSQRDDAKFEKLYTRYQRPMLWWALHYLQDHHLAEDASQEAFLRLLDRMDLVDEVDSPRTQSLCRIVLRNVCLNMQRQIDPRELLTDFCEGDEIWGAGPSEIPEEGGPFAGDEALSRAVVRLKPQVREMLWLYYECEASAKEIAGVMGLKAGSVNRAIHRARKELKTILEEDSHASEG